MKKLILAAVVAGFMSTTSLMAGTTGTVTTVRADSTGTIKAQIATSNKVVVGTPEAIKAMLAILLTAKSSGATVQAYGGDYAGALGWTIIELQ